MNGIVAGRQTQPLSQREVLDIGLTAVSSGEPDDAIVWFIAGLNHNISPLVDRQAFYHGLARAHAQVRHYDILYTIIGFKLSVMLEAIILPTVDTNTATLMAVEAVIDLHV